jgi:hypothetical protein
MNANKLLRFAEMFYSMAAGEKLPENSKDVKVVLKNLSKLETFLARKKYAEKNFKHLGSGSSRVVYLTPDKTVVKLAKNNKGLAQNKAESNPKMKSKYLNKIFSYDKKYIWMHTDYLDNITPRKFKKLTGFDFDDFGECVRYRLREISDNSYAQGKEKPESYEEISKSSIFKGITELGDKFHLMSGDLAKLSSYGTKDDQIKLIDAGLTKKVFEDFYEE